MKTRWFVVLLVVGVGLLSVGPSNATGNVYPGQNYFTSSLFDRSAVCTTNNESDIALILDRSSSMNQDNKWVDAKAAISTFISNTIAPPDQLTLVSFASNVTVDQTLTTTKSAVINPSTRSPPVLTRALIWAFRRRGWN